MIPENSATITFVFDAALLVMTALVSAGLCCLISPTYSIASSVSLTFWNLLQSQTPLIAPLCLYRSAYDVTIPAQGKAIAKTDIAIACPEGTYGRVGKMMERALLFPNSVDSLCQM